MKTNITLEELEQKLMEVAKNIREMREMGIDIAPTGQIIVPEHVKKALDTAWMAKFPRTGAMLLPNEQMTDESVEDVLTSDAFINLPMGNRQTWLRSIPKAALLAADFPMFIFGTLDRTKFKTGVYKRTIHVCDKYASTHGKVKTTVQDILNLMSNDAYRKLRNVGNKLSASWKESLELAGLKVGRVHRPAM